MGFKMKGSAFKLGTVQGTSSYRSALQQSCPPGTTPVEVDENGNPIQMKSALKQYTDAELERKKMNEEGGMVYTDDVVVTNEDGTTTTSTTGTQKGTKIDGARSGDPERSKLMSEAIARGDKTFEYNGKTYTTERGSSSPDRQDEMSYTTGPKIVPIKLDPITPSLVQDVETELKPVELSNRTKKRMHYLNNKEEIDKKRRKRKIYDRNQKIKKKLGLAKSYSPSSKGKRSKSGKVTGKKGGTECATL